MGIKDLQKVHAPKNGVTYVRPIEFDGLMVVKFVPKHEV